MGAPHSMRSFSIEDPWSASQFILPFLKADPPYSGLRLTSGWIVPNKLEPAARVQLEAVVGGRKTSWR